MCTIVSAETSPQFSDQLRARLESEWGIIDPFEGPDVDIVVPPPLFLLSEKHQLVGGLVFSSYAHPNKQMTSVWINALLVEPAYRGQGYASGLVHAAEVEAVKHGIIELFMLSEFPALYQKLGWNLAGSDGADGNDSVLMKSL